MSLKFLRTAFRSDLVPFEAHGKKWLYIDTVAVTQDGRGVLVTAIELEAALPATVQVVGMPLYTEQDIAAIPQGLREAISSLVGAPAGVPPYVKPPEKVLNKRKPKKAPRRKK